MVNGNCYIKTTCKKCEINGPSYILFSLKEVKSYASSIQFNIISTSSIPKEVSSINITASPDKEMVFRGPEPTILEVLTIASAYETNNPAELQYNGDTGYHVMNTGQISKGTQYTSSEMQFTSDLYARINFKPSESSLMTRQVQKFSLLNLAATILGSIFGLMTFIGKLMSFIEKLKDRIKNIQQKKQIRGDQSTLIKKLSKMSEQYQLSPILKTQTVKVFSIEKARQKLKKRIKISQVTQQFSFQELYEDQPERISPLSSNLNLLKQQTKEQDLRNKSGYISLLKIQQDSLVFPSAIEESQQNQMQTKEFQIYTQENQDISKCKFGEDQKC